MSSSILRSVRNLKVTVGQKSRLKNQTFRDKEIIDLLLMRDIEQINSYFDEVLYQAIRKCLKSPWINTGQVYLVQSDNTPFSWTYILGGDLIVPNIFMPTTDQLTESFDWYKRTCLEEDSQFKNIDDWVERNLLHVFERLKNHVKILSSQIYLLRDVFKNEGEDLKVELLNQAESRLRELRKNVRFMKIKNAPEFLVNINSAEISKTKEVLKRVGRLTY